MADIVKKTDQNEDLKLMLGQYRKSTNLNGLVATNNKQSQDLEDALFELRDEYYIDTAEGVQLDVIGNIFKVERKGSNDTEYRQRITVTAASIGSGEPEFIISALLALYGATYVNYFPGYPGEPASFTVITDAIVTIPELTFLAPAGVKPYLGGYLLLEDGTSFLLQEDGVSKLII
jgi:hypothetical protein